MTAKTKSITGIFAITTALILSAQSLYACTGCGCTPSKKAAETKAGSCTADKKSGKACTACPTKKAAASEDCPSGVCALSSAPKTAELHDHDISTFQLKGIVDSKSAILLDARSAKYDDGSRIPGAQSLTSQSTPEEIALVIPSKDAQIVTYCSNPKCPASKKLADHLKGLGYTQVHEYPEGIAGWKAAGGPISKAK